MGKLLTSSEVELMETFLGLLLGVLRSLLTSSEVELMETKWRVRKRIFPGHLLTSSEVELMETSVMQKLDLDHLASSDFLGS